jgi:hypothetical protein
VDGRVTVSNADSTSAGSVTGGSSATLRSGGYAEVVQNPSYRDDKAGTTLETLPELLTGRRGARLVVRADDTVVIEGPGLSW